MHTHTHTHTQNLWKAKFKVHIFMNDIPLCYIDSKNKVQTINHDYIYISLLLATCLGFCDKLSGKLRIHKEERT